MEVHTCIEIQIGLRGEIVTWGCLCGDGDDGGDDRQLDAEIQ